MAWRSGGVVAALLLAGCGSAPQGGAGTHDMETFDVEELPADAPAPAAARGPQIAYRYTVRYAFDRDGVAAVQGRQLALCRRLGPARCVVVRSSTTTPGPNDHVVSDETVLLIDARQAEAMHRQLDAIATGGGATLASRQVEAEDVTRQVIDTDARVRAKQALADRLLTIIRSGNGKIGELVEAERAYATTQEELDAARGERADLARRVAMSTLTITYSFSDMPGADSPVGASLASAGATFANSVAALLTFVITILPWAVVGVPAILLLRRMGRNRGWRLPWWPRRRPRDPAAGA